MIGIALAFIAALFYGVAAAIQKYCDSRNYNNLSILIAVLGGLLMGIGAFLLKMELSGFALEIITIPLLLLNPIIVVAAALSITGFVMAQRAMHAGHLSIISSIVVGMGIMVPITLAYSFMSEPVAFMKILGIVLVIVGVLFLSR
ncbi:MAG: hypothetical protein HZB67_01465 [Candidatus Aenigmarchaeota archaeon]|nr:hypothetical protein [Candidatus Aenigmarchaeota archaeon]